jgi:hypothetical protein
MAATATHDLSASTVRKLGVARLATTGAVTALVFYLVCWIGALLPLGYVSHMYLQLFTNSDIRSTAALVEGSVWSIVFGLIAGALIALFYNAFAFLDRK